MTTPGETEPAPVESAAGAESPEWNMNWLKEIVTVVLAVAIVAATLWLLVGTFLAVDDRTMTAEEAQNPAWAAAIQLAHQQAFEHRQTVLSIGISLVGVVTGYFFGRLPAERRAQVAEQTATNQAAATEAAISSRDEALQAAGDAEGKLTDVRATFDRMTSGPTPATLGAGGGGSVADIELRALKSRMGW